MKNTYAKYCPNVWVAKCSNQYKKGDVIQVTNKYQQDADHIVHNLVLEHGGFFYYSIERVEQQTYAQRKAEKYAKWAKAAADKSDEYYERSRRDADFLALGEPIKIGHHSENRHRKAIEYANNQTRKSVEASRRADYLISKAAYWTEMESRITLAMPDSVDYFLHKLEIAKEYHRALKAGEIQPRHSLDKQYAAKDVRELTKKYETALKLWGDTTNGDQTTENQKGA